MARESASIEREEEEDMEGAEDLRPVFVVGGESMKFCFHSQVTEGQKEALAPLIIDNGGTIVDAPNECDTLLATELAVDLVKKQYGCSSEAWKRQIYVESLKWIRSCIRLKQCVHKPLERKGMPGRYPGSYRNNFTLDDEDKLCYYISRRIPDPTEGGRQSMNLYKELVEMGHADDDGDGEYAWAKRHTWESWKEHYKRNAARLDPQIEYFVKTDKPRQDVQYPTSRHVGRVRGARHMVREEEEEEENEGDGQEQGHEEQEQEQQPEDEDEEIQEIDDPNMRPLLEVQGRKRARPRRSNPDERLSLNSSPASGRDANTTKTPSNKVAASKAKAKPSLKTTSLIATRTTTRLTTDLWNSRRRALSTQTTATWPALQTPSTRHHPNGVLQTPFL